MPGPLALVAPGEAECPGHIHLPYPTADPSVPLRNGALLSQYSPRQIVPDPKNSAELLVFPALMWEEVVASGPRPGCFDQRPAGSAPANQTAPSAHLGPAPRGPGVLLSNGQINPGVHYFPDGHGGPVLYSRLADYSGEVALADITRWQSALHSGGIPGPGRSRLSRWRWLTDS